MNFIQKKYIPRRAVIRGIGASFALPFLESMIPALGKKGFAQSANQKNFLAIYFPFGVIPSGQPQSPYYLNQNLSPLQNLFNRDRICIMRNLQHTGGDTHPAATFLTANYSNRSLGSIVRNSSFDQRLVGELAQKGESSPIPSLVYGTRLSGRNDQPMRNYISFAGPGNPLPKEDNLQRAFNRLFNVKTEDLQAAYQKASDKSVLDGALASLNSFMGTLPSSDRQRMGAYLNSVRSLERQVSSQKTVATPPPGFSIPNIGGLSNINNFERKAQTQAELALMAMQTGVSRIATIMLDDAYNGNRGSLSFDNRTYHDSGKNGSMHFRMDSGAGLTYLRDVQRMLANVFRHTIERSMEWGVFEESAIIMGSECGRHHVPSDHVLLAGGGLMGSRLGTESIYNQHIGRLYTAIAQKFGIGMNAFGASSGALSL